MENKLSLKTIEKEIEDKIKNLSNLKTMREWMAENKEIFLLRLLRNKQKKSPANHNPSSSDE